MIALIAHGINANHTNLFAQMRMRRKQKLALIIHKVTRILAENFRSNWGNLLLLECQITDSTHTPLVFADIVVMETRRSPTNAEKQGHLSRISTGNQRLDFDIRTLNFASNDIL